MPNPPTSIDERLSALRALRKELGDIRKEAFMAAPPMPGAAPPMDPAMMGGGGAPPMDPAMMGAPPMGGDPAAAGPGPLSPEMIEELLGVIEELAAASEQHEATGQQLAQQVEELMARQEDLERRLATSAVTPP